MKLKWLPGYPVVDSRVKVVEPLRMLTNRVKVKGVKDAVERAANSVIKYERTRDPL